MKTCRAKARKVTDAISVLERYAELMAGRPAGQAAAVQLGMVLC